MSIPSHTTLWRMMKRFENTGCVVDRPISGRLQTAMNEENIETVALTFVENQNQSATKVANHLGIPRTSLRRIIKHLNLKIYRPMLLQAITEDDLKLRVEFCELFLIRAEPDPHIQHSILMVRRSNI